MAGIARCMDLDLPSAKEALRAEGIWFESERDSIERITRANGVTPMTVYGITGRFEIKSEPVPTTELAPEEVEARYAGSGLGRKSLSELWRKVGLDQATAMGRVAEAGISARP